MTAQPKIRYTFAEYLEIDRNSEVKSEFINGEMVAMAGASWDHGTIVQNLARGLGNRVAGGPCRIRTNDIRVKVNDRYTFYPDVLGLCIEPQFAVKEKDALTNPELVIEVLSPSTQKFDSLDKMLLYQTIPSLNEYLLISQSRPHVLHHTKQGGAIWQYHFYSNLDDTVMFSSIHCSMTLREIYADVVFTEEPLV